MRKRILLISLNTIILFSIVSYSSSLAFPAFPGAEGYGSNTIGGRGGEVYIVTNTNDSGPGSLRECIEGDAKRICLFSTGGTITLSSTLFIVNPYITIAGQTAPGGGITIKAEGKNGINVKTHDVVIRYLTVRNGSGGQTQSIFIGDNGSTQVYNIVIDHCSLSWATDEVITTWYRAHDLTFQWNIISEGLDCSTHPKGCHSKGSLMGGYKLSEASDSPGGYNMTAHHNLYAHNGERMPLIKNSGRNDIINNVMYNPFWSFGYFDMAGIDSGVQTKMQINYIGNYAKKGPDTDNSHYALKHKYDGAGIDAELYVKGNLTPNRQSDSDPQNFCVDPDTRGFIVSSAFALSLSTTPTSATQAYTDVLSDGGAGNSKYLNCSGNWVNRRDAHDTRILGDVQSGTAFRGTSGSIINDESDVGGWLTIPAGSTCADTDSDGMPDDFETAWGFDPKNSSDNNLDYDNDGYTNLEEYLNSTSPGRLNSNIPNPPPNPPEGLRIISYLQAYL